MHAKRASYGPGREATSGLPSASTSYTCAPSRCTFRLPAQTRYMAASAPAGRRAVSHVCCVAAPQRPLLDPEYEALENGSGGDHDDSAPSTSAPEPPPRLLTKRLSRKQADWAPAPVPLRLEAGETLELARHAADAAAAADGSLQIQMVQWYPGHIARAERQLQDQLKMVDVVLEVRDARIPVSTHHPQVAKWVGAKPTLLVLNRTDMISKRDRQAWAKYYREAGQRVFWTDGREGGGVPDLKTAILEAGVSINEKRAGRGLKPRSVRACVIGFPNIGKSALINRLLNRKVRSIQ